MIKIEASKKNNTYRIEMQGHAGFNPGNDIVCAAASMLIQTLQCSILIGLNGGVLELAEFSSGNAKLLFHGGGDLFKSTLLGFEMLQKAYPDHVFLTQF